MKIQWKIMYIRCTDRLDLFKTSNSLNVQNCENPMDNCLLMYYSSKFDEKFEIVESTKNLRKNCVHQMYRQSEFVEKFRFVECVKS